MIQSVFMIGIILTVALVVIGFALSKVKFKGTYTIYTPFMLVGAAGLILLLFATIIEKITIMGAGLGGWGIACLFASSIGFITTSISDAYAQEG